MAQEADNLAKVTSISFRTCLDILMRIHLRGGDAQRLEEDCFMSEAVEKIQTLIHGPATR